MDMSMTGFENLLIIIFNDDFNFSIFIKGLRHRLHKLVVDISDMDIPIVVSNCKNLAADIIAMGLSPNQHSGNFNFFSSHLEV